MSILWTTRTGDTSPCPRSKKSHSLFSSSFFLISLSLPFLSLSLSPVKSVVYLPQSHRSIRGIHEHIQTEHVGSKRCHSLIHCRIHIHNPTMSILIAYILLECMGRHVPHNAAGNLIRSPIGGHSPGKYSLYAATPESSSWQHFMDRVTHVLLQGDLIRSLHSDIEVCCDDNLPN